MEVSAPQCENLLNIAKELYNLLGAENSGNKRVDNHIKKLQILQAVLVN